MYVRSNSKFYLSNGLCDNFTQIDMILDCEEKIVFIKVSNIYIDSARRPRQCKGDLSSFYEDMFMEVQDESYNPISYLFVSVCPGVHFCNTIYILKNICKKHMFSLAPSFALVESMTLCQFDSSRLCDDSPGASAGRKPAQV